MTGFYVLDTDHITLLQRNHPAVISRFTALPPERIAVTVVSAMEQVRVPNALNWTHAVQYPSEPRTLRENIVYVLPPNG
jgi:hypothetical protein